MVSPCKDCKDRKLACHASCNKYLAFNKERVEARKKSRQVSINKNWTRSKGYDGLREN